MFTRDLGKVLDILKELTLETDSKTWINVLKCVRKSIQQLQANYDVTLESALNKQVARSDLNKIFYKNETNFTFDKYVTKLKGMFNVLDKYGVSLYEDHMKEHLLDQIISPNTELKTEFNIYLPGPAKGV